MASVQRQIPMFFKCFNDEDRTKKLDLPKSWCSYMGRSLPCEAILRNKYGDCWEVKIAHYQNTDEFWFEEGWRTFAEQNKLAYNDRILFKFDGKSMFDFELFDEHDDEKDYVRVGNSEEERNKEQLDGMELDQVFPEFESELGERGNMHSEPVESESQLQLQLEPQSEERQQQSNPEELQEMQLHSEVEPQLEPETEERQDMQPEQEPIDWEENTRSRRTVRRKRAPAIREEDEEAVFQSGFPRPNNPYFVTKRRCKRNELYVPAEVVKDFNLIFPDEIEIHDERGRKWTAKVCKWKDGRLWLSKGWRAFCKWNLVQRDDWCIIEIVRPETPEAVIFLRTHLVPAAALRAARRS